MASEDINPWLHIWTEPRKTMRSILETNPNRHIIWLAILSGILGGATLALANWMPPRNFSNYRIAILGIAIIVGAIAGILMLYFSGWLITLTGSWLGGKGNFTQVKSAIGWGNYPNIVSHLVSLIQLIFFSHYWLQIVLVLIGFAIAIWAFIVSMKLIGEAHQFSAWKSILALVIGAILVFVVIMIIALLIPLLKPLFQ